MLSSFFAIIINKQLTLSVT